jgi:hypothetical protein
MLAGVMFLALVSTCSLAAQAIEVEASANDIGITCASPGTMDATGSLLSADSDTFDLDLCTPTQDCSAPKRAHFRIHLAGGPPLNELLDHASFVHVQLESAPIAGMCRERIAVSGLAKWLGDRSPTRRPDEFYLAAIRNWSAPATGWPFIAQLCPGNVKDTVSIRAPGVSADLHSGPPGKRVLNDGAEWTLALERPASCAAGAGGWSYWVSRKAER